MSPLSLDKIEVERLLNTIRHKVEEILPGKGYFVVNVSLKGSKNHQRLEVLVDGDSGIDINVCSQINRELSQWLDQTDLISGHYVLEVGSPGTEYPLNSERSYHKNIGRELKVVMNDNTVLKGKLIKIGKGKIDLATGGNKKGADDDIREIGLEDIRKSTVIVSLR